MQHSLMVKVLASLHIFCRFLHKYWPHKYLKYRAVDETNTHSHPAVSQLSRPPLD